MAMTAEERKAKHMELVRKRYRLGIRAEQEERVAEMVDKVQLLPYEEAVKFVQEKYIVKEFKK